MSAVLDRFKIRKYFQVTVTEDEVTESKPNPEIYLKAAQKLKIDPGDCIVIEDTDSGIQSATDAGMKCLLYTKYTAPGNLRHKAELTFVSFKELISKIGEFR